MKELLAVISLLVLGAVAEPPAPYPPSGWRPSGPSFELPQRESQQPQSYLPPVDPRNPSGPPADGDVSVQGLPQPEQRPLFQASPISGQQYAGPNFNKDLKSLDESFQQSQYQQQQERYREYQRQRELEAAKSNPNNRLPTPVNPRQFTRTSTTEAPTTTQVTSTTGFDLNQEEILNESEPSKLKTSVEVTKQNVKEYPGEFFLSSLAQLQLQPQFVQLQTSGAYAQPSPISGAYIQPQPQKQVAGFDGPAHFSALPSVLAQQKNPLFQDQQLLVQQPISQFAQAQVTQYQPQPQIQSQYQPDPVVLQAPAQFQPNVYIQPNPDAVAVQPTSQYAPSNSYQPAVQPQFIAQPVAFQPQQPNFARQPEADQDQNQAQQNQDNQNQQQFYQQPIVVQPFPAQNQQDQFYQPQGQFDQTQNQYAQPQTQFLQPGQPQTQFLQPQPTGPQNQYAQPQLAPQGQYGQPQGQFVQQQGQFVQPQLAQPEVQYLQPQYAQPQLAQGQLQQPQSADLQNQYMQPQLQYLQPQLANPQNQYLQPQFAQPQTQYQPQFQGQDNLQSGLDINQQGNDIDEPEDDEERATAVATAFGTRTQPRVNTRYGAPFPVPKVQANPGYSTTTESAAEEITEEGPAVAQAVAVANGERRKSSRLRTRRIRPVYAVDRSGRLILAEA